MTNKVNNFKSHPHFNYDIDRIIKYSKTINDIKDRLNYLEEIINDIDHSNKSFNSQKEYEQAKKLYGEKYSNNEIKDIVRGLGMIHVHERGENYEKIRKIKKEVDRILNEIIKKKNNDTVKDRDRIKDKMKNNEKVTKKIQWLKDTTLLIYLFEEFYQGGFISSSDRDNSLKFIEAFFKDKNGNNYKLKNLTQTKNNLLNNISKKPRDYFKINKINEELKKKEKDNSK